MSKTKEVQVGKEITDARKESCNFYRQEPTGDAARMIFYFHDVDDYLKGRLFGARHRDHQHYSNKTYLLKVTEGRQDGQDFVVSPDVERIEEIIAYRDLRRIIEQNELMHSIIRIVYIGRIGGWGGHHRKVWEVFKDIGRLYEHEEQQTATPVRKRAKKKGVKHGKTQSD